MQFVVVFYKNVYQFHSKEFEEESISKKMFTALLVLIMIIIAYLESAIVHFVDTEIMQATIGK